MRRAAVIAGLAAAAAAAPASAATVTLVPRTVTDPGCALRAVAIPVTGFLTARLDGRPDGPDADLSVHRGGRRLAASRAFGGAEVVTVAVTAGDRVGVRTCGAAVPLSVSEAVPDRPPPERARPYVVSVRVAGRAALRRLLRLGADLNETYARGRVDAVLHGPRDARLLRRAGFAFRRVRPPRPRAVAAAALPSGRTAYRRLADYQAELKALVVQHPGLVRPATMPGASVEGRPIEGIEIAEGVERTDDGRPTYVLLGLHHAREWSSGEVVMELAHDLAAGHGTEARITNVLRRTRTFLFPVINPDGLVASQAAGFDQPDPGGRLALTGAGSYRRKNCAVDVTGLPCAMQSGVDLNRNYGAFWGGPGASDARTSQVYRGRAPFSEPETRAVRAWSSAHHVMVVNSVHNYGGTVLHQPGFTGDQPGLPDGAAVPGRARMVAVARAMAEAAGYGAGPAASFYEATGAAEDWNHFSQGAFGYTIEVGYDGFHPDYQDAVVDQYLGTVDGRLNRAAGREPSAGLREAFLRAAEAAADPANHAVIAGTAPAGRTLRLRREFETSTSYVLSRTEHVPVSGPALRLPERLETTLTVPPSGRYEWHVNPSTRPVAALAGRREAWTLTCEDAGRVAETRSVVVGLGDAVTEDLPCDTASLSILSVTRRGRHIAVRLSGTAAPVAVTLRDARGRLVASARRTRAERVRLRARAPLRAGTYTVRVVGGVGGATLVAVRSLRVPSAG